jgi:hypothetical protein
MHSSTWINVLLLTFIPNSWCCYSETMLECSRICTFGKPQFDLILGHLFWMGFTVLIVVIWVVTLCSLIGSYQVFGEMWIWSDLSVLKICTSTMVVTTYKTVCHHNRGDQTQHLHNDKLLKSHSIYYTVTYFHPSKADVGVVFYKRQWLVWTYYFHNLIPKCGAVMRHELHVLNKYYYIYILLLLLYILYYLGKWI